LKAAFENGAGEIVPATNTGNIKGINHKILAFELFCGVGYYNQLFSLELAVYMAVKSGRYLILNVRHPLAACGRPNRAYGLLVDYLDPGFKKLLCGFEVRAYKDYVTSSVEIKLPSKISSCVVIDPELDKSSQLNDFVHYRQKIKSKNFWGLLNGDEKVVYFAKSNASRVFGNFFTTSENYKLMSNIALQLSRHRHDLQLKCSEVLLAAKARCPRYLAAHLRLGDWHKKLNQTENIQIMNNLKHWLKLHNHKEKLPIFFMTDKKDNPLIADLKKDWEVYFTEDLVGESGVDLGKMFPNLIVAQFHLEQAIVEGAEVFFGCVGSTVSGYINYKNYLAGKPCNKYLNCFSHNFDRDNLCLKEIPSHSRKSYTWNRLGVNGGHSISWSRFFEDNIIR